MPEREELVTVYLRDPRFGIVYRGKTYYESLRCDRRFANRMIGTGKGTYKKPKPKPAKQED